MKIDRFVRKHTSAIDVERLHQRGLTKIHTLTYSKINELVAIAVAKAVQKYQSQSRAEAESLEAAVQSEVADELVRLGVAPPAIRNASRESPSASETARQAIEERLRLLFAALGGGPGASGDADAGGEARAGLAKLERRLLEIVGETLAADRGEGGYLERLRRESERRTDLLERRLEKLREHNEQLEIALRELESRSDVPGIPSIYRQVQGLDAGDARYQQKKDALKVIFEDNLRLQSKTAPDKQAVH